MQINIVSDPFVTPSGDSWYPRLKLKTTKKILIQELIIWTGDRAFFDKDLADLEALQHLAYRMEKIL